MGQEFGRRHAISMRELQKMSAGTIQALPHAVPIRSGTETVAVLVPVRNAPAGRVEEVLGRIREWADRRTPEEQAAIDELFAERGIVD